MNISYVITSGSYSDYRVHSVWSDKTEAEKICKFLNGPRGYQDFMIEEFPFNSIGHDEVEGWVATYDCAKYGYTVDITNIEIGKAIIDKFSGERSIFTWQEIATAQAETKERTLRIIFDLVAEEGARKLGLTE
jgi:hypothetical protein